MFRLLIALTFAAALTAPAPAQDDEPAPLPQTPEEWATWTPPTDGGFQTWGDEAPSIDLVKRVFAVSFAETCAWSLGAGRIDDPEIYTLSFRYDFESEADEAQEMTIYRLFCGAGAYNEHHVYMSWTTGEGLRPIAFAEPSLAIKYVDDNYDGALESLTITGFDTAPSLVNSFYNEETQTITSASHWRGLGDASSSGVYAIRNGQFSLITFDVDPTYDGEINPYRIYDASNPTPVALVPLVTDTAE